MLGCARTSSNEPLGQCAEQHSQPAQLAVTISKETTYLIEPLRSDGYPDYVTALNRRCSQGVTPENNAAVPFLKALGPGVLLPQYREQYCQMLGISPLPEQGDYFIEFDDYVARRKDGTNRPDARPEADTDVAMKRPWSQQEFPLLAQWLLTNETPMTLVVEASNRPRRYDPLCCGEKTPLLFVPLPAIPMYRNVAQALCARAMLRLHQGQMEETWEDLLTCHRLARLAGQGPTVIDVFIAYYVDEVACMGGQALLQHAQLTASQATQMREDLDRLPAMPRMADKIDLGERFTYLNSVADCAADFSRRGSASLIDSDEISKLASAAGLQDVDFSDVNELDNTLKSLKRHSAETGIDWDFIFREGNSWFDRIAAAYRESTRTEQKEAMSRVEDDFRKLRKTAADAGSLDELMLVNPRNAVSTRMSQVLLTVCSLPLDYIQYEDRWSMRFELNKLGFALASYRADHGTYPAELANLAPNHVVKVPKDIFNDSDLHYRLDGKGYLLYSVGVNGKDDGGKNHDECNHGEDWDDLVVRVRALEES